MTSSCFRLCACPCCWLLLSCHYSWDSFCLIMMCSKNKTASLLSLYHISSLYWILASSSLFRDETQQCVLSQHDSVLSLLSKQFDGPLPPLCHFYEMIPFHLHHLHYFFRLHSTFYCRIVNISKGKCMDKKNDCQ